MERETSKKQKVCCGLRTQRNVVFQFHYTMEKRFINRTRVADLLEQGEILTLEGSRYVLVVFGPGVEILYLRDGMRELQRYGYFPILAYAERYDCLYEKKEK